MLSFVSDQSERPFVAGKQEAADVMRLLRLLVAQVESSGRSGVTLSSDGAPFQVAKRMLDSSPEERASTRTALMALRDFVWRVDSVRSMLSPHTADPAITEALKLLDTSDIHQFLRQEP